jgi:hypothetical protein
MLSLYVRMYTLVTKVSDFSSMYYCTSLRNPTVNGAVVTPASRVRASYRLLLTSVTKTDGTGVNWNGFKCMSVKCFIKRWNGDPASRPRGVLHKARVNTRTHTHTHTRAFLCEGQPEIWYCWCLPEKTAPRRMTVLTSAKLLLRYKDYKVCHLLKLLHTLYPCEHLTLPTAYTCVSKN